jgi:hypothetical protein
MGVSGWRTRTRDVSNRSQFHNFTMPKPIASKSFRLRSVSRSQYGDGTEGGGGKYIAVFEGTVANVTVSTTFNWNYWDSDAASTQSLPFEGSVKYLRNAGLLTYNLYPMRRTDASCVLPWRSRLWDWCCDQDDSIPFPGERPSSYPIYTSPTTVRQSWQDGGEEFLFVKEVVIKFPRYCPGDDMSDLSTRLSCLVTPYVGQEWGDLLASPPRDAARCLDETVYVCMGPVDFGRF